MTRRRLQVALGLLWLLDGALQLQPFMLGRGFARQNIDPAATGQPQFVSAPIHWAANVVAAAPVACDVAFAGTQLALGVGLLVPRTARLALAASIPWALGVWYVGEGLSGLASGHASLISGGPGSALLYALLAVAAWPRTRAWWLPVTWMILWLGGAILQVLPGQNTGAAVAQAVGASAHGWIASHGPLVVTALATVEALIGLGALDRSLRRAAAATGFALAAAMWIVGQDAGGLASGRATDPNTGPLLMLMALVVSATSRRPAARMDLRTDTAATETPRSRARRCASSPERSGS